MSGARMPSSFEGDEDFYNEGRMEKLWRQMKREPLIPIGTAATCYALWRAFQSMRKGTHHETNRMFRMRIYGQSFTLIALVGYAFLYSEEHALEKKQAKLIAERKAQEKKDAWIRELEARDQEAKEERARQQKLAGRKKREALKPGKADAELPTVAKSALERSDTRRPGILEAVTELLNR